MKFNELRQRVLDYPLFTLEDIFKYFPEENRQTLKLQLSQWIKKGYLTRIKRGIFKLSEAEISDHFSLAPIIYAPSYISLESALNSYGIIPDVPFAITSVTLKKTKTFKTEFGLFIYRHLKTSLFFGFTYTGEKPYLYQIAQPEKALLDYLYLNLSRLDLVSFPHEYRFELEDLNWSRLRNYARLFESKKLQRAIRILKNHA